MAMCGSATAQDLYKDPHAPAEKRVEDLLGRLTQDEKLRLIGGVSYMRTAAVDRLGIPSLKMSDGPAGVREGKDTVYAAGMALAASWDTGLAERVGASLGRDGRARGVNIQLGPGIDLYRAPFCGRNFEYFGEDPLLTGYMAAAYIRGLQSQGVAATMKHFAANDQEYDRNHINSEADERTLRELSLKPFEIALREGGPWCVMDSYNPINGVYATANAWLNNTVLKGEWGFRGVVMSDWGATHDALGAANGGLDLEMPGRPHWLTPARLLPLLASGQVTQATLDDKVRRILRMMISLGFLDRPQLDASIPQDDPASAATALAGAREGIVLLKNAGGLLPLDRSKIRKIVVLGRNADPAVAVGGGSAHGDYLHGVSVLQGLKDVAGPGVAVVRIPWSTLPDTTDFTTTLRGPRQAYAYSAYGAGDNPPVAPDFIRQVKNADLAVVCVGFNDNVRDYWQTTGIRPDTEGEGHDRTYELPPGQEKIIEAVIKLNPHTVVILNAGGGIATAGWIESVPALLDAFYPGQAGGEAVAEILFGKANPSGRLPFTWEKKWEDSSAYGDYPTEQNGRKNIYAEGVFSGYRWFDSKKAEPLFPFGFGMSYTTFSCADLRIRPVEGGFAASCSVQNTGGAAGDQVVQLYIAPPPAPSPRPVHELKGFARVSLKPGETKRVTVTVKTSDLAWWNPATKRWTVTPGTYTAELGWSSRDIPLRASFQE